MGTRYLPYKPFMAMVKGVPMVFNPDYTYRGLPGYPALPEGVPDAILNSFYEIEVDDGEIVEQATAAPTEKRSVKKPTSKRAGEKTVKAES